MEEWDEIAFSDKEYSEFFTNGRWPVLGNQSGLRDLHERFSHATVAIGNVETRLSLLEELALYGFKIPIIRHPASVVAADVVLGEGSVILAGAIINTGTCIGRGCIINTGASVDHDCMLGDGVHVCPGARLAGEITVGSFSWIGIGAVVIQQRKIGERVTVGANAAVIHDVPDNVTVVGVPANALSKSE
jgi:sugar O-acyltransferase (sialic acid O-acetyltransferase NeuD family)